VSEIVMSVRIGDRDTSSAPRFERRSDPSREAGAPERKGERSTETKVQPEGRGSGGKELSPEDEEVVRKLAQRDTHVRAHEAAHQAAARGLAGGASFTYETGPDGQRYAVGGEVPVQLKTGRTPDETIANAQAVRAAALAPADPSAQDMAVAAEATQMEGQARQQKSKAGGEHDPERVLSALMADPRASSDGTGNAHTPGDGCGLCRANAARYGAASGPSSG
jgi:hypothetical protein